LIELWDHAEGCIVSVRAQPGARRTGVVGEHGGSLKIAVNAPPDKGKANKALVDVLGTFFGVPRAQIELLSGHAARDKRFLLRGLRQADVRNLLEKKAIS